VPVMARVISKHCSLGPVLAWRRPMSNQSQAGPAIMARSNSSEPGDDMHTPPSDDCGDSDG
jgi:hypothetical protein